MPSKSAFFLLHSLTACLLIGIHSANTLKDENRLGYSVFWTEKGAYKKELKEKEVSWKTAKSSGEAFKSSRSQAVWGSVSYRKESGFPTGFDGSPLKDSNQRQVTLML